MNGIIFMHAYKFTHFSSPDIERTNDKKLSFLYKVKIVFTGVNNPRPVNRFKPDIPYDSIKIRSNKILDCWLLNSPNSLGTVILFHGYGGEKSSMLDKAYEFMHMGYSTLLVDFMGAGASEGNETTIGYKEAVEVSDCFNYIKGKGENKIVLFGTSMGAVAIMKAINDYEIHPSEIIIECPFGTMYKTVCSRFHMMHIPSFPMAGMLMFWGGIQNGFWAFNHNPENYARNIHCPVLLLYGENDIKVSKPEIDTIYSRIPAPKKLVTFPLAGHENYLMKYRKEWTENVSAFLFDN
jgi:alpha-beta hydrolase superfamily lysophospholipase